MVKPKQVIVILSILVAGIIVFLIFYPSEERQVRKRFRELAQTATVNPDENPLIVASKCKKISKFFARVCRIQADEYDVSRDYSQKDIHTIAIRVLSRHEEFHVTFMDLHVNIPEKGAADTISTARIVGKVKGGDEYLEETHEVEGRLRKIEDEWVFVKVELVDVLKK